MAQVPYAELQRLVDRVLEEARKSPTLQNLQTDLRLNTPEVRVTINRDKLSDVAVNVDTVGRTLETMLGGRQVTRFKRDGEQYDVIVQLAPIDRTRPADISETWVRGRNNEMVQLSNLVDVKEGVAPQSLNHFHRLRAVKVTATLAPGYTIDDGLKAIDAAAKSVLPPTAQTDVDGQSREFRKSGGEIYFTFVLALLFIYLVLAAQFESFVHPFVIMLSVPLSMTGALLFLWMAGGTLNIYSQVGLVTLVGLITKHGILIVEFSNQLRDKGTEMFEAVVEAATLRLRPILMTTGAMVLGALPLALATGAGAESRTQIGWVIVGGMSFGTLLTLFVVPTAYTLLAGRERKSLGPARRAARGRRLARPRRLTRRGAAPRLPDPPPAVRGPSIPGRSGGRIVTFVTIAIESSPQEGILPVRPPRRFHVASRHPHRAGGARRRVRRRRRRRPGPDRDPVVAFDDRRARRPRQRFRQGLQREPEGIQGRPGLQGHLSRVDGGGDRGLPRRQRAGHPAGVRGRHGDDDGRAQGAIIPVAQVMKDAGEKFDPKVYIPAVAGYYTTTKGEMLSFPFNSSTTVFYYNKDLFQKAGLDPDRAPATWPEVMAAAAKIKTSGTSECAYTTGWPSWAHVENFSAWHNVPIGTRANGMDGLDTVFQINTPLHVRHWSNLQEWGKKGYFTYGGRTNQAEAKFYSGECAMLTSSSAAQANINRNAKFKYGVGFMPYYADVAGAPQNSIIGGASLWVMSGKPKNDYKGVAKFFTYLSDNNRQAQWHQQTGYLPITLEAYEITKRSGFYEKNPGTDISVRQMNFKPPTANSKGLRFGSFVQIRDVFEEEFENMLAGKQDAKTALDNSVKRGNELLRRFEKSAKGG